MSRGFLGMAYVPFFSVSTIYAATSADVEREKWENDFLAFMAASHNDILESITTNADIDEETETKLKEAIEAFNKVNLA